jgi:predicted nuclease of predicted toxin-antitoxin system
LRFLVDESLSPRLATLLRDAGHEALHVRDLALTSAPDRDVLANAKSDERVLITADTDFGTLLALEGADAPSVILFRRTGQRRTEQRATILLSNIDRIEASLEAGCIAVFENERLRIRDLPIGREDIER